MQTTMIKNASGTPKSPGGAAIALGIVLIGLLALIVYELKGRTAATRPVARTYTDVMAKITSDTDTLRKELSGQESLDIETALSERIALKKELAKAPPPPDVIEPAAPSPAESGLVPAGGTVREEEPAAQLPDLKGIMWTERSPLAIVNGALAGVGDSVGTFTVSAIEKDRVIFKDAKGEQHTVWFDKVREAEQKAAQ